MLYVICYMLYVVICYMLYLEPRVHGHHAECEVLVAAEAEAPPLRGACVYVIDTRYKIKHMPEKENTLYVRCV
jgi:hypothetical protein